MMALSTANKTAVVLCAVIVLCLTATATATPTKSSSSSADVFIVESIPLGLDFDTNHSIADAFLSLLQSATQTVDIACMYMTFSNNNATLGGTPGQNVYDAIVAAAKRGVKVRIAKSHSGVFGPDDVEKLVAAGYATAQYVNFSHIEGGGVLHTKFMIIDEASFYVGSANMDWRALTQIKELGIHMVNQQLPASELTKVFNQYWLLGQLNAAPKQWPASLTTTYNEANPMKVNMNGTDSDLFFSIAPNALAPKGWTLDQNAIQSAMLSADEFIWVEVMDYVPAVVYEKPNYYWNVIDNAIRTAAYNSSVQVRVLIGYWEHSMPIQQNFLQSLNALVNVEVRYFIVPPYKKPVPYTRVNHAKWMVTDKVMFIDTSNWTGDYFVNTAGVGTTTSDPAIHQHGTSIFERDWFSAYSHAIPASG